MTRWLQCPYGSSAAKAPIGVPEPLQLNPAPNVHSSLGSSGILSLDELVLKRHKYRGGNKVEIS